MDLNQFQFHVIDFFWLIKPIEVRKKIDKNLTEIYEKILCNLAFEHFLVNDFKDLICFKIELKLCSTWGKLQNLYTDYKR